MRFLITLGAWVLLIILLGWLWARFVPPTEDDYE